PGLGRSHDQCALALSERTEKVDHAVRVVRLAASANVALQHQLLVRVLRAQAWKVGTTSHFLRGPAVHRFQPRQGRALPTARRTADLSADLVARAQAELLDQLLRDVDVV